MAPSAHLHTRTTFHTQMRSPEIICELWQDRFLVHSSSLSLSGSVMMLGDGHKLLNQTPPGKGNNSRPLNLLKNHTIPECSSGLVPTEATHTLPERHIYTHYISPQLNLSSGESTATFALKKCRLISKVVENINKERDI